MCFLVKAERVFSKRNIKNILRQYLYSCKYCEQKVEKPIKSCICALYAFFIVLIHLWIILNTFIDFVSHQLASPDLSVNTQGLLKLGWVNHFQTSTPNHFVFIIRTKPIKACVMSKLNEVNVKIKCEGL